MNPILIFATLALVAMWIIGTVLWYRRLLDMKREDRLVTNLLQVGCMTIVITPSLPLAHRRIRNVKDAISGVALDHASLCHVLEWAYVMTKTHLTPVFCMDDVTKLVDRAMTNAAHKWTMAEIARLHRAVTLLNRDGWNTRWWNALLDADATCLLLDLEHYPQIVPTLRYERPDLWEKFVRLAAEHVNLVALKILYGDPSHIPMERLQQVRKGWDSSPRHTDEERLELYVLQKDAEAIRHRAQSLGESDIRAKYLNALIELDPTFIEKRLITSPNA